MQSVNILQSTTMISASLPRNRYDLTSILVPSLPEDANDIPVRKPRILPRSLPCEKDVPLAVTVPVLEPSMVAPRLSKRLKLRPRPSLKRKSSTDSVEALAIPSLQEPLVNLSWRPEHGLPMACQTPVASSTNTEALAPPPLKRKAFSSWPQGSAHFFLPVMDG